MPKQIVEDSIWKDRLNAANKYYDKWEALFKCGILEKYYEGNQWKAQQDINYRPYTINKVYETIQIKIDQYIPQQPIFNLTPAPAAADFDLETAAASTQLKEDVLNTIVYDNKLHFHDELELAYKDSFFRFGIIEVGYAADWVENPNAHKPLLNVDVDKDANKTKPKVKQAPEELPANERVFFKHIPAKRFRIGGVDNKYLDRCSWCGYYEWVSKADLLALPKLMNRDKIDTAITSVPESSSFDKNNRDSDHFYGENLKVWHLWDNKSMMRLLILDSPCVTLFQRKFKRLPLFDYRPDRRVSDESFYPIPPVFHWLSPQDEINETREMLRKHRRRFIRKFQIREGLIDDEEEQKWEEGDDGTLVKVKQDNAIQPIPNADLGNAEQQAIMTSADDLNQISGTSAEVRGVADRTTATQANIITQKANIRQDADRDKIAIWMEKIARESLLIARDRFVLGLWARLTSVNKQELFQEVQTNLPAYQWVTSEDLNDGYDFRVMVDVASLTGDSQQVAKQQFLEFMAVTSQFSQIAMSPNLIREAAYRVGYRNEKVIKDMQKMALLHQAAMMAQAGVGQGQPEGNPMAQQIVANRTPPNIEQARNQMTKQVGLQ